MSGNKAQSGNVEDKQTSSIYRPILNHLKPWQKITAAISAIFITGSAIITAGISGYNYFITRKEFERVNCKIHLLLEINSLELTEKKLSDIQFNNNREIARLQMLMRPNQSEREQLHRYQTSQQGITPKLVSTEARLDGLRKDATGDECQKK